MNGDGFISLVETILTAGQRLATLSIVRVNGLLPDPSTVNSYFDVLLRRDKSFLSDYSSRIIDRIYDLRKEQMINGCQLMDDYCITVNFWKEDYKGVHFGAISLDHIDKNEQLYVFILGCYPYEKRIKKRQSRVRLSALF